MHTSTNNTLRPIQRPSSVLLGGDSKARSSQTAIYAFLAVQFLSSAVLVIEAVGEVRVYLRAIGFASALGMFFVLGGLPVYKVYPVRSTATIFVTILSLGLFHPNANTFNAGMMSLLINLAIWSPAFWCCHVAGNATFMRRVMLFFWITSLMSSVVGMLQVYDPDRFAPAPEFVRKITGVAIDGLMVTLADGRQVFRPMGLSDSPGGASTAGAFAVIFGLFIAVSEKNLLLRLTGLAGCIVGMFCIYLCQVRSVFVMTLIGVAVFVLLMLLRGRLKRLSFLILAVPVVLSGGFIWATSVGGRGVTDRLDTLTEQPAGDVYYKNRGHFVEETLTQSLFEYPLGAGLGRWGMSMSYFGDPNLPNSQSLWAEIQITGWLYDGGLPLIVVGYLAVLYVCYLTAKIAIYSSNPRIADMAAAISSLNLSLLAVTFNYSVFISQMGITFFLLNGLLYMSAGGGRQRPKAVATYA